MTIRLLPPGRRSISAWVTVQGSGANHCFISSGSVQQRNSFSRGASIRRVRTSSRLGGVAVVIVGSSFSALCP